VACHEGGHALVAWLLPLADPVHKVTIVPHGQPLDVTSQVPGEDRGNFSREYLCLSGWPYCSENVPPLRMRMKQDGATPQIPPLCEASLSAGSKAQLD
jgi:hypothetical protein